MEEKTNEEQMPPSSSNEQLKEINIYKKNLETNKNKVLLFDFLMTVTKIDYCFEKIQSYLYWVGLMEFFFWFILIGLFISDIKYMAKVFFFIFHIPRGIIGIIILYYLPKTYEVINGLENFETNSLEEIKEKISANYIKILNSKEVILKPLLISYFVSTMITIIVDIVMFCVITPDFGLQKVPGQLFAVLLLVNVCLIAGDFVYILFFTGFKYFFPPSQNEAAHKAVIGFFTQLKVGIAIGFTHLAKRISKKPSNVNNSDPRNSKVIDIPDENTKKNIEEQKEIVKEGISLKVENKEDDEKKKDLHINEPSLIDQSIEISK